jgi:hypothetical protein
LGTCTTSRKQISVEIFTSIRRRSVKRTKSPALTSPWKIGFFVSLMLIFVSIGVTYYFVQRYGLSLGIVDRNWLDRHEWLGVIRGQGVLFEVLPLVALVSVSSVIAYLVITSAVRKYKKYLDSGLDYKHLLTSLKEINDLEDKSKIERIKNHPELKRLLLGVADSLEERERLLAEREGALETRLNDALAAREKELADDFASQCDRLARALGDRSLDASAIEFSNPNLKQLSDAIQKSAQASPEARASDVDESFGDLRKTSSLFQSKLREIAQELKVGRDGAQEIEQQVRRLVQTGAKSTGTAGPVGADANTMQSILTTLKSLEDVGSSIDVLSEEAKGVAISAALHAGSGTGTQDDLIRLAEDVKEVATRFKEAAKRFSRISGEIRATAGGFGAREDVPSRPVGAHPGEERNLSAILSRVTLWVERMVVLSDKLSNLRESYELAMGTLAGSAEGAVEPEPPETAESRDMPAPVSEDSEEFEFESLDRRRTIFTEESTPEETMPSEETPAAEPAAAASPVDETSEDEELARPDVGPEGDRTVFEEITSRPMSGTRDVEIIDQESAVEDAVEERMEVLGSGAFARKKFEGPKIRDDDRNEKTVDLYALGAVDYDPALHG